MYLNILKKNIQQMFELKYNHNQKLDFLKCESYHRIHVHCRPFQDTCG